MNNNVSLRRVDNDEELHAQSVRLSLDVDSWTWSVSVTLPAHHFEDVQRVTPGVPVELEVTVNSHPVRFLAEDIERQRTFGEATLNLTGRGISAALSGKYSPFTTFGNTEPRTMQQLANDVLSPLGVPLGWDVEWELADWTVPGNVWTAQGSYMDALVDIAAAAGGYVQPHSTDQALKFLKRYPVLPWDWTITPPDFELPSDVVTVEGIAWRSKPVYNRVYVHGASEGVLVPATRAGTAGDKLAQTVVHSLITHVDGGRARAEPVLADVGEQADVRIKLPVFPEVGLILPGSLVKYADGPTIYWGLARAIQVEANHAESWQTVEVETHA